MDRNGKAPPTIPPPARRFPFVAALALILFVYGCSIYANLSFAVTNKVNYKYFPPFKPFVNANTNGHLGAEYFNIARAIRRGDGFADPFSRRTGATAWMPPILPGLLAGLLWLCNDDKDAVMGIVVFLQVLSLIATGLLVLAFTVRTTWRIWAWAATVAFCLGLVFHFHHCFQVTHDCWLVLLTLDLLLVGVCWCQPLRRWQTAAVWGVLGGFFALVNPLVGMIWGAFTLFIGRRRSDWRRLGVSLVAAAVTLAPWTARNYLVLGRLIPVKSNLAYELYQSQRLQPDGLIQATTFGTHPYQPATREGQEYRELGETAFLDKKQAQFWQAVGQDPINFLERVADRFFGATLWYVPFNRSEEYQRTWELWFCRLIHPLPFLALLFLVYSGAGKPLDPVQWAVVGVYALYLLPYIGASYYERYAVPMIGVKVLLVLWAADRLLSMRTRAKAAAEAKRAPAASPQPGAAKPFATATP
jgi:hypothetical protein